MKFLRAVTTAFVLCQLIAVIGLHDAALAQTSDTVHVSQPKKDTTHGLDSMHTASHGLDTSVFAEEHSLFPEHRGRTIDLALTGGAGFYRFEGTNLLQPTANGDFYARSSELDLNFGFHWGFSDPSTKALILGLRFPLVESQDRKSGIYTDAGLLLTDNGSDTDAFSTGVRAAIAARSGIFEARLAGEVRKFPFDGEDFEGWAGIEFGITLNLLTEQSVELTPKDSLRTELSWIATSAELEQLDEAQTSEDIDRWLDKFWAARNVTGSPRNEERNEYMARVKYANEKFGTPIQMGVKTDRGRALLLYGQPTRVETATSTAIGVGSSRKFQLWVYENRIKGYRVGFFLFLSGQEITASPIFGTTEYGTGMYANHGDYRQIYSNIPGEYSEGVPSDLPYSMVNYIESFQ